jgi:hypothetical protein
MWIILLRERTATNPQKMPRKNTRKLNKSPDTKPSLVKTLNKKRIEIIIINVIFNALLKTG